MNKASVLWLGAGIAAALLGAHRPLLRTRGPWLALAIAVGLFVPNVVWQALHHFPTVEFAHNALVEKYKALGAVAFATEIGRMAGPVGTLLALLGIVGPLVRKDLRRQRPLGGLAVVLLVVLACVSGVKGSKPEYLGAAFPAAFALGAVVCAQVARTRARRVAVLATATPFALAYAALALPFVLPVLGEDRFVAYMAALGQKPETSEKKELGRLPQYYADMHGWPEHADAVARALTLLTPEEREHAVVFSVTGGYGPAAAIEHFGRGRGFPPVVNTHNSYWLWGSPDPAPTTFILVGGKRESLEPRFESLQDVETLECTDCMPYENHKPIRIGRGARVRLQDVWPSLKHYE